MTTGFDIAARSRGYLLRTTIKRRQWRPIVAKLTPKSVVNPSERQPNSTTLIGKHIVAVVQLPIAA